MASHGQEHFAGWVRLSHEISVDTTSEEERGLLAALNMYVLTFLWPRCKPLIDVIFEAIEAAPPSFLVAKLAVPFHQIAIAGRGACTSIYS